MRDGWLYRSGLGGKTHSMLLQTSKELETRMANVEILPCLSLCRVKLLILEITFNKVVEIFFCLCYLTPVVKEATDYVVVTVHDSCWQILGLVAKGLLFWHLFNVMTFLPTDMPWLKAWVIHACAVTVMILFSLADGKHFRKCCYALTWWITTEFLGIFSPVCCLHDTYRMDMRVNGLFCINEDFTSVISPLSFCLYWDGLFWSITFRSGN